MPECVLNPWGVQWRVAVPGKTKKARKTRNFATEADATDFAKILAGDAKRYGTDTERLNPDEARNFQWLRAEIGPNVTIERVVKCWHRHGAQGVGITVSKAVELFTAAKTAEGLAKTTLAHLRPAFDRLKEAIGDRDSRTITRAELVDWMSKIKGEAYTQRTYQKQVRGLFQWLKVNGHITDNPTDGLKLVRIVADEVEIMTVEQAQLLFSKNISQPRELCGRLALECFAGLRYSSACATTASDIQFAERGIVLPAASIKTRRRQFIDGLPDNLWAWLKWSKPETWTMNPRAYLRAKSFAFVRAGIPHVHNACRHSFATYHMSLGKDAAKTAAILCHTSQGMLWRHYRGRATEKQGKAYFQIKP